MFQFDPTAYDTELADLLRRDPPPPLGPGRPERALGERLQGVSDAQLFAAQAIKDRSMAACCRSGLLLLHDFLDASHEISQQIHTPTGSYWHGIMHRREPDYSNAKYWFRKVGSHPCYPVLLETARHRFAGADGPLGDLLAQSQWDASAMVDLCAEAAGGDVELRARCEQLQLLEWQILFDYCYRRATGAERPAT